MKLILIIKDEVQNTTRPYSVEHESLESAQKELDRWISILDQENDRIIEEVEAWEKQQPKYPKISFFRFNTKKIIDRYLKESDAWRNKEPDIEIKNVPSLFGITLSEDFIQDVINENVYLYLYSLESLTPFGENL